MSPLAEKINCAAEDAVATRLNLAIKQAGYALPGVCVVDRRVGSFGLFFLLIFTEQLFGVAAVRRDKQYPEALDQRLESQAIALVLMFDDLNGCGEIKVEG